MDEILKDYYYDVESAMRQGCKESAVKAHDRAHRRAKLIDGYDEELVNIQLDVMSKFIILED